LGNPPWDKLTLELDEFFAVRAPKIADSSLTQAERQKLIEELEDEDPALYQEYCTENRSKDCRKRFLKNSGRFPTSTHGILNLYAPFSELALNEINSQGRAGIVVQTGIATDSHTQEFFRKLVDEKRLSSLYDFKKDNNYFKEVDKKFSLLSLVGEDMAEDQFELGFYLDTVDDLSEDQNRFTV
ncbi:MAG: restriction endonuclease, partial [Halobacteriaceae archaeon]